ncbi:MAG TPA: SDR family oxidoreductase [Nitrospiria bacterium]|jgi:NAD(P)-dependent dehydrogenase (short-subunit alcohol dehydrogenase family)|nr:SDR family oxidoreductase [Nitrospiria bacterium]
MNQRIGLLTGANRGIGYEVARQLAERNWTVILTARDEAKGRKAVEDLARPGFDVRFHWLDVSDPESIRRLARDLAADPGRLDVLVNNAGILEDDDRGSDRVPIGTLRATMETNFFGPFELSQALLPLLRKSDDARIINVSSGLGQLSDGGGGYPAYSISKAALNMMTVQFAEDLGGRVRVNSVCPGWVRTGMGGPGAPRSVERGAESIVWLATDPKIPNGKFIRDRKEIGW